MKIETLFSSDALDNLHKKLGGGRGRLTSDDQQTKCLMQHREDHVWIWSTQGQELLVAVTGSHNSGLGAEVQTVSLHQCPDHEVTGVSVSRTGHWVAVWGAGGVTVVQMPPRGGVGGRFGGGKESLLARSFNLDTLETGDVQSVSWHPGSAAECHLVVLTRSGVLTLYNVMEMEDRMTVLQCHLTESSPSKVSTALGEVAVDFCFGCQSGEAGMWPLFVLLANCDVYCVGASLLEDTWTVEGPLEMRPQLEDNYSDGEGCSIVEVGGVLAFATVLGVLYHAIVLGGEKTSLHVYERVELEIGAVSSHEDVFSCPLSLSSNDSLHCRPGYLACHAAGLHNVNLPMVNVLKQAEMTDSESPDLDGGSSVVEHLVCSRPTPSSPLAPVLGACVASPPATILCLLASNQVTSLPVPSSSLPPPPLLSSDSPADDLHAGDSRHQADQQLLSLLTRRSTQPLIKAAPDTDLTPAVTLELLSTATGTLRREYVARLQVARGEMVRRVQELAVRRTEQEKLLGKLEKERTRARDKAEELSEKYEDVKDRGQELSHRVENVLSKLQAKIPHLSDKELAMAREVSSLDRKVQSLEGGVKQLKEKEKYQRYQIGVEGRLGSSSIKDSRLDNIKEVLQRDSKSIAEVVKSVNELKKDLEM